MFPKTLQENKKAKNDCILRHKEENKTNFKKIKEGV